MEYAWIYVTWISVYIISKKKKKNYKSYIMSLKCSVNSDMLIFTLPLPQSTRALTQKWVFFLLIFNLTVTCLGHAIFFSAISCARKKKDSQNKKDRAHKIVTEARRRKKSYMAAARRVMWGPQEELYGGRQKSYVAAARRVIWRQPEELCGGSKKSNRVPK